MRALVTTLTSFALLVGCASTPGANPHDMSVAQHEAMARKAQQGAAEHQNEYAAQVDSDYAGRCYGAGARPGAGAPNLPCWTSLHDQNIRHAERADDLLKAAADHRAASQALRDAEAASCSGVADRDRDISPFAHRADVAAVQTLPNGAAITFAAVPGLTADSLRRIVDCHIARNAALGHQVPEMPWCPLVPNHVSASVAPAADGRLVVTITSSDPDSAREVVRRAQALQTQ